MSRFTMITERASLSKVALSLSLSLGLLAGNVQAAPISDLLFPGELNQLSDNSGENQNVDLDSDSELDVGDTLRGTLDIGTIEDLSGGGGTNVLGAAGNNELSGLFEAEVTSLVFNNAGADTIAGTPDDIFDFTFGPNAAFAAECGGFVGAIACFYEDATPDYDRTGTVANAETTATDGILRWVIGMDGSDGDELWTAQGPLDPTVATNIAAGSAVGVFDFQLSTLFESFDVDFEQVAALVTLDDGLIDVNASGSILGTFGATSDYEVFNNVDFTVRVANPVPEPSVLPLFGVGLFGLAFVAIRRRRS